MLDECRRKRQTLQRKSLDCNLNSEIPSIVHEVLGSPGQPLNKEARAFFEPRFGHDFGNVRVHTDAKAAESAKAVSALAYTVGRHIAFGEGHYKPGSAAGQQLLAHELTHTLHQRLEVQQSCNSIGTSDPDSRSEREANSAARAIFNGRPFTVTPQRIRVIARQESQHVAGALASFEPTEGMPVAKFERFVTKGPVRCCRAAGPKGCPAHLGAAKPGDPSPRNGMNLVASVSGHRPGIEYGFVQVINFRQCARLSAAIGGGWIETDRKGPGADDSPIAGATCRIPDAHDEITMTDAPGLAVVLGGPAIPDTEEVTHRVNATDWVIAREPHGRWQRISELFPWHSVTHIHRNAAGNWELTPHGNRIGSGYTKIGGCPP